jgi:hypothetical protein
MVSIWCRSSIKSQICCALACRTCLVTCRCMLPPLHDAAAVLQSLPGHHCIHLHVRHVGHQQIECVGAF